MKRLLKSTGAGLQTDLFRSVDDQIKQPLVVAYGLGVDSTAALVEMKNRGIIPDAILFADTGDEKEETYQYLPIINRWLVSVGFPQVTTVRYQPKIFKDGTPYSTLGENCLANGTLPSLAFGMKSCSLKWKVLPQNQWTDKWTLAVDYWRTGGKVKKVIGYDASAKDMKRYAHAKGLEDDKYEYWYPLIEWNLDREACKQVIRNAGLPVPPKSACKFCPATRPEELHQLSHMDLKQIIMMEAKAKPKLQGCMTAGQLEDDFHIRHSKWQRKLRSASGAQLEKLRTKEPKLKLPGQGCAGLWRKATKTRPAAMSEYIANNGLLSHDEIETIQQLFRSIK